MDWDNPIHGFAANSVESAQRHVPFEIYKPKGLNGQIKLLVSPLGFEPEKRAIAFLFDAPEYGRVAVIQHFPDVPAGEYDAANENFLQYNGGPETHGTFEIVIIRDGRKALITTSEDGSTSSIFWLEGDTELMVRGPLLQRNDVIEIAEKI